MPSWNIHTAHVERLFASEPLDQLGIRDRNLFLFGNFVPDIYVGNVVQPIPHKISYKETHFADPRYVPTPDAARFYELYASGANTDDLVLGAWTHLLCDHYYNLRTNEYIARIGVEPGEQTRIRKQADFDAFGRTLRISSVPYVDERLVEACANFAQYPIAPEDVRAAVHAQERIVQQGQATDDALPPAYSLLSPGYFEQTFAEVDEVLREGLHVHARGGDPTYLGRLANGGE